MFKKGEVFCIEGTWSYEKVSNWQEAVFEIHYNAVRAPINIIWKVDGITLSSLPKTVSIVKNIEIAQPKSKFIQTRRVVSLAYSIEQFADGSRLKLYNVPSDESFSADIEASVICSSGSGIVSSRVNFNGMEYVYPPEFNQKHDNCILKWLSEKAGWKVLLPAGTWRWVPVEKYELVNSYLKVLGHLKDKKNQLPYHQLISRIRQITGIPDLELNAIKMDDFAHLEPTEIMQDKSYSKHDKKNIKDI